MSKSVLELTQEILNVGTVTEIRQAIAMLENYAEAFSESGDGRMAVVILEGERRFDQYVPCIAKEGIKGYYRTDWLWGEDKAHAEATAKEYNRRLGLTEKDAIAIVLSTMG